jgi:hypothetical protein
MDVIPDYKLSGVTFRLTGEELHDLAPWLSSILENDDAADPLSDLRHGKAVADALCVTLNALINTQYEGDEVGRKHRDAARNADRWAKEADRTLTALREEFGGETYARVSATNTENH